MPKKKCGDTIGDVPAWFMTYSDVITLLMTFFILLLTFATNEPEHFEKMQVAMFGGGSASGVAGRNDEALDRDSLLMRFRPDTARLTTRGSEMPPQYDDPTRESLDEGLKSLDSPHALADAQRLSITLPLPLMVDAGPGLTTFGAQQLQLIVAQLRKQPMDIRLEVSRSEDVDSGLLLATAILSEPAITPARVAIAIGARETEERTLTITLTRPQTGGR